MNARVARCLLLGAVTALGAGMSAQTAGRADELAGRLQKRYEGIRDFEADFVQTIAGGVLRVKSQGEGHLYVKKPGKMKWVYVKPERQELILDGQRAIQYFPDAKEATVSSAPSDGSAALLFLAGRGNIQRDFIPAVVASTAPGTIGLRLTPRKPEPTYEYFVVVLDEKSATMRTLIWFDSQGSQTTTDFRNLKENAGVPDKTFDFSPPRGVDVFTPDRPR
jgi:outer membrane lipoprotein carrier protein